MLPIVDMIFNESPKIALESYHPDLFLHILNPAEHERKLKREGVEELYLLDFSSQFDTLTKEDLKDYFDGEIIIVSRCYCRF